MSIPAARATSAQEHILEVLSDAVGPVTAQSICRVALSRVGLTLETLEQRGIEATLVNALERGLRAFCTDERKVARVRQRLLPLVKPDSLPESTVRLCAARGPLEQVCGILAEVVGARPAKIIVNFALGRAGSTWEEVDRTGITPPLIAAIEKRASATSLAMSPRSSTCCISCARSPLRMPPKRPVPSPPWSTSPPKKISSTPATRPDWSAKALGFDHTDQIKISTAVSELGRNIVNYAGRGTIRLMRSPGSRNGMFVEARDDGPGIPNVDLILSGKYVSRTGLGLGIVGCKRLMDELSVQSVVGKGTCVTMVKYLEDHSSPDRHGSAALRGRERLRNPP